MNEHCSEIARLRQQIELECQSIHLGLTGLASTAAHKIIHYRYESLTTHQEQLSQLIGEHEAAIIVAETYIKNVG